MRVRWKHALIWVLGIAGPGALGGATAGVGLGQQASEQAPAGWSRGPARASYVSPGLLGNLPPRPGAWSLQRFETLQASQAATRLEMEVELIPGGELNLSLRAQEETGPTVVVRRGQASRGVLRQANGHQTPLSCSGSVEIDQDSARLVLTQTAQGFLLEADQGSLECSHKPVPGETQLAAGLGRARVSELSLDGVAVPPPAPDWWPWAGAGLGAMLSLLVGAVQRRLGLPLWACAAALAPLWACTLLVGGDLGHLYEIIRLPHQRGIRLMAAVAPAVLAVTASVLAHLPAMARRPRRLAAVGCALVGALGIGWTGLLSSSVVAGIYLALCGLCVGGLAWLWAHPIRFYNLASLALAAGFFSSLEMALRWTELGRRWDSAGVHGEQGLTDHFRWMEEGAFGGYPGRGFPAAFEPRAASVRVVCMGGSSTGGAFQNDELSEFYPAKLGNLTGAGVEVLNQGAAAWTSFHIALYADKWLTQVDPDIVTIYLGVNETEYSQVPYDELYEAWRAGRSGGLGPLGQLRLLQGLRYLTLGLRNQGEQAVPPEHMQANLTLLGERMAERGGRVLLMSEAAYPSGEPFLAYREAMAEVAEAQANTVFLDTAPLIQEAGSGMFLDQNHLSEAGHRLLAKEMNRELTELGWLKRSPRSP